MDLALFMEGWSFGNSDKMKSADVCVSPTANNNSTWPRYVWLDGTNSSVKQPSNLNYLLQSFISYIKCVLGEITLQSTG